MVKIPVLAHYDLLVLHGIVQKSTSVEDVLRLIGDYPENAGIEGDIRREMRTFASSFPDLTKLKQELDRQIGQAGGLDALEAERDLGDFDEFMSGWD